VLTQQITALMHGEKTREQAINAYEDEMKVRAGTEVRLSAENTRMVHVWEKVTQSPLMTKGFAKLQSTNKVNDGQ
jgi:hypothetical protein